MQKVKILVIAANPSGTALLTTGEELRAINAALSISQIADKVSLLSAQAASADDLLGALHQHQPTVLHISAHANKQGELLFQQPGGLPQPVAADSLCRILGLGWPQLQLVVLNACYSAPLADAIAAHVPGVVGMQEEIKNRDAVVFAWGLYRALGYGRSVGDAVKEARLSLEIASPSAPAAAERVIAIPTARIARLFPFADALVIPPGAREAPGPEVAAGTESPLAGSGASQAFDPESMNEEEKIAFLRTVPTSPLVPPFLIDIRIQLDCSNVYLLDEAEMKLQVANQLRMLVDPDGPAANTVQPGEHRSAKANDALAFWTDVFTVGRKKSPRMLAAVLLTVYSSRLQPHSRQAIRDLLLRLRHPEKWSPSK